MRLLKYRSNSGFEQSAWEYWDYLCFIEMYTLLNNIDVFQRKEWQYSFVQDSYYALSGQPTVPFKNEFIQKWDRVISSPQFSKLKKVFEKESGKLLAVLRLSELMMSNYMSDEQRQEYESLKQKGNEPSPQEEMEEDNKDKEENDGDNSDGDGTDENDSKNSQDQNSSSSGENKSQDGNDGKQNQKGKGNKNQPNQNQQNQVGPQENNSSPTGNDRNPLETFLGNAVVEETAAAQQGIEALMPYVGLEKGTNEKVWEALNLLSKNLDARRLASFLGFAKKAMQGAKRDGVEAAGEFTGYKNTTWDINLHPLDRGGVLTGDIRFVGKMAEGTLRKRVYSEEKPRGRGPVILLRDESGSMGGEPHMRALELEIALANVFRKEHREFVSIAWSSHADRLRECLYGRDNVANHIVQFIGGGTELAPALTKAINLADEYIKGDILVISDGDIADEIEDLKKIGEKYRERGGRVWFVQINKYSHMSQEEKAEWADGTIEISAIGDEQKLQDLLSEMNKEKHMKKRTIVF